MAKLAPEDPEYMPVLGAQPTKAVPAAYDEATARLGSDVRAKAARGSIDACEKQGAIGAGFFENHDRRYLVATSAGMRAAHASSEVGFTMTARTPDGTGSDGRGERDEGGGARRDVQPSRAV
jgi:hypothetical protein